MSSFENEPKPILIVDDDPDVRLFLSDRLQVLGFQPLLAINGQEGLEILHNQIVHGVLLDMEMPIMGGMEMLKAIRESSFTLPVIMMSADEYRLKLIEALTQGASDFLTKPINYEELSKKCWRLFR